MNGLLTFSRYNCWSFERSLRVEYRLTSSERIFYRSFFLIRCSRFRDRPCIHGYEPKESSRHMLSFVELWSTYVPSSHGQWQPHDLLYRLTANIPDMRAATCFVLLKYGSCSSHMFVSSSLNPFLWSIPSLAAFYMDSCLQNFQTRFYFNVA